MDQVTKWFQDTLGVSTEYQLKIFASVTVVVLLWACRGLLDRLVARRTENLRTRYVWSKTSGYVVVLLGILLVGRMWFQGIHSMVTFLGLLSAGLAIALKDPVANFAGWLFIIWFRPFELGDRIEVGDHAGDVIDIRVFQFTLMEIGNWVDADQSTGRVIHVPNFTVLNQVIANYSKGFRYIWNEIPVLITFESDWRDAKDILARVAAKHAEQLSERATEQLRQAARKQFILYTKLTPIVYTTVKNCGVMLTIRYLCEPQNRRGSQQSIWEEILTDFGGRDDIDFAYPTQRFYDNRSEGKPRAGGVGDHAENGGPES